MIATRTYAFVRNAYAMYSLFWLRNLSHKIDLGHEFGFCDKTTEY